VTKVEMPKMKENEIDELIREQFLCRIAFIGELKPYIAPFQYVVVNGSLYFHFTDYGKKMSFFKQETPVCVEIERYTPNLSEYGWRIMGKGKLQSKRWLKWVKRNFRQTFFWLMVFPKAPIGKILLQTNRF
jgi:nitroimidazol reductase NimA-like FMN-containing flavoprotein (pyridoxamine 5'-phosphate oxidase superfamily)